MSQHRYKEINTFQELKFSKTNDGFVEYLIKKKNQFKLTSQISIMAHSSLPTITQAKLNLMRKLLLWLMPFAVIISTFCCIREMQV